MLAEDGDVEGWDDRSHTPDPFETAQHRSQRLMLSIRVRGVLGQKILGMSANHGRFKDYPLTLDTYIVRQRVSVMQACMGDQEWGSLDA